MKTEYHIEYITEDNDRGNAVIPAASIRDATHALIEQVSNLRGILKIKEISPKRALMDL